MVVLKIKADLIQEDYWQIVLMVCIGNKGVKEGNGSGDGERDVFGRCHHHVLVTNNTVSKGNTASRLSPWSLTWALGNVIH